MSLKAVVARRWVFCAVGLAALCFGCRGADRVHKPSGRVVYCDLSVLVRHHPAWRNAQSASIDLKTIPVGLSVKVLSPQRVGINWPEAAADKRSEVQSQLYKKAEAETARMGAQMNALLDLRVADKRAQLEAEARVLEAEQVRLSQQNLTKSLSSFWEQHGTERTAAVIRLAALKSQLNNPAVNQDALKSAIDGEQSRIDELSRQEMEIERSAAVEIESIHNRYAEKIESELADFTKRAASEMEVVLARRRESLLGEFGGGINSPPELSKAASYAGLVQFEKVKPISYAAKPASVNGRYGYSIEQIHSRAAAEIKVFVNRIAERNGLAVTFRKGGGAEDYTDWFAKRLPYSAD